LPRLRSAVRRDTPASVYEQLAARAETAGDPRLILTFPVTVPKNFKEEEVQALLKAQGYDRIHARTGAMLEVVQDRVKMSSAEKARVIEGIEAAFKSARARSTSIRSMRAARHWRRGGSRPTCTVQNATSTIPSRCRAFSHSTPPRQRLG